jgi:hypothetical protein
MPNPLTNPMPEDILDVVNSFVIMAVNKMSLNIYFCGISPQSCKNLYDFLQSSEMGYKPVFEKGCLNISEIGGREREVFLALVQDLEKYYYGIELFKPDSHFFSTLEYNGGYSLGDITFQREISHTFGGGGMLYAARFNDLNLG